MAAKKMIIVNQGEQVKRSSSKKWLIVISVVSLVVLLVLFVATISSIENEKGNIALISITGAIGESGSPLGGGSANPDDITGMLEQAEDDSSVKGILIEINSPGGTPVASEEIMKAVRDSTKPTVALIRDIGTSGAYWVASAASYIVASPVSITGSVGVRSDYLQFSGLLDKYGVTYERLVSGEYKDMGSAYRNLTDAEREILMDELAKTHDYFLNSVANNRHITSKENLDKIATARIFLGSEAKELGLVDALGGKTEAEGWLMQETNLTEINYVTYEKDSLFSLGSLLSQQASAIGSLIAQAFASTLSGNANNAAANFRT